VSSRTESADRAAAPRAVRARADREVAAPHHAAIRWWPLQFGADDQHGMLNHVTDAKRAHALALVRRRRMYDLGHVLDERVPVFPGRYFRQT